MSNIQSSEIQVIQIPAKDNGFHAICHARLATSTGQIFSAIGEAICGKDDTHTVKGLLQQAEQDGISRALRNIKNYTDSDEPRHDPFFNASHEDDEFFISPRSTVKIKPAPGNEGGGKKAITEKQKDAIIKMCGVKNKNQEEVVSAKYNKELSELTGNEAHNIIKELQKL
jgi:hypothetical protein